MSSSSDFELIHGQLHVTNKASKPEALGRGQASIRGATYMQGPAQIGQDGDYSSVQASLMVGRETNPDTPNNANRSLYVKGDSIFDGDGQTENAVRITGPTQYPLYVDGNAYYNHPNIGDLSQRFNLADARPKPFDMIHPSLGEGNRLRYACIEGPEVGVYFRGRVKSRSEIELPWYWKDLVHVESISVQLQPVGSHQDVIVKRWDSEKVYLQSKGGMPIDCFYHIYAERKDVNALVVEYVGNSWQDYPDPKYNDPQYQDKVNTVTNP